MSIPGQFQVEHFDLFTLITREPPLVLGRGAYRTVYAVQSDPTQVLKYAPEAPEQNILEAELWHHAQSSCMGNIRNWLAPVIAISKWGVWLLQTRVEQRPKQFYPSKVPACFTDLKYTNFGWLPDGRFVSCDYAGYSELLYNGKPNLRLVKAAWWE